MNGQDRHFAPIFNLQKRLRQPMLSGPVENDAGVGDVPLSKVNSIANSGPVKLRDMLTDSRQRNPVPPLKKIPRQTQKLWNFSGGIRGATTVQQKPGSFTQVQSMQDTYIEAQSKRKFIPQPYQLRSDTTVKEQIVPCRNQSSNWNINQPVSKQQMNSSVYHGASTVHCPSASNQNWSSSGWEGVDDNSQQKNQNFAYRCQMPQKEQQNCIPTQWSGPEQPYNLCSWNHEQQQQLSTSQRTSQNSYSASVLQQRKSSGRNTYHSKSSQNYGRESSWKSNTVSSGLNSTHGNTFLKQPYHSSSDDASSIWHLQKSDTSGGYMQKNYMKCKKDFTHNQMQGLGIVTTQQKSNSTESALQVKKKSNFGLRILTGTVAKLSQWRQLQEHFDVLFEIIALLDSAVTSSGNGLVKHFTLKDPGFGTPSLRCVFYEIDRTIPKLTRGYWQRCMGRLTSKNLFHCYSVHPASKQEQNCLEKFTIISEKAYREALVSVTEM